MEANNNKIRVLSNSFPNIPQEIITETLTRVPTKSLLKFKCVCKSWLSLITSSHFINTHLSLSSINFNNYSLICFDPCTSPIKLFTCSISSILTTTVSINPINLDFPFKEPIVRVVGACDGLLCVTTTEKTLVLCNPTTKMFKNLVVQEDVGLHNFGFCYDKLSDDYKVVKLSFTLINGGAGYETRAKVYSLRDDYWREIDGFKGGGVATYDGISVGGIIHWSWFPNHGSRVIISLNVATYEYGVVLLPEYDKTTDDDVVGHWTLREFGGCLGVSCDYFGVRVDIWVMKEYGVKESWFKLVSIPYPSTPCRYIFPICESGNGEVICTYGTNVMVYDPRNCSVRNLAICSSFRCPLAVCSSGSCPLTIVAPPYIESLVPLSLDG